MAPPSSTAFAYTFDRFAEILNRFNEALGLSRYTPYMQDHGGPVGFRMAMPHPDRVEALIVQDAVAHNPMTQSMSPERRSGVTAPTDTKVSTTPSWNGFILTFAV